MISKTQFVELYKKIDKFLSHSNLLTTNTALNQDLMLDIQGFGWDALEYSLSLILPKTTIDWLYWWFFEKPYLKTLNTTVTILNKSVPAETVDDLWYIIEITEATKLQDIENPIPNL